MRHGQTNYNVLGLCNDDPKDNVHLTEMGMHQAEQAAEKLKHVKIDRIITSELLRTQQTAKIINKYHNVSITSNAKINDIKSGFNNQSVEAYMQATHHDRLHSKVNGGESLLEYKQRVITFLQEVIKEKQENTLVIAHEETMRIFYVYFHGLEDIEMLGLSFGNCEYFEVV